jgi:integrase
MLVQEYLDIRSREFAKKGNGKNKAELVSGDAVRLDKALLGSIFKFAKIRKLVPVNIMRDTFETPTCNAKEARISFKQQNDLFRVAKEYALKKTTNKCLLSWLYFVFETGTRPGEAAKAELSWFDLKARKVSIPRAGQKKRNPRIVIIRQELADVLKERMQVAVEAGSKYMFWSRKKERLAKDEDGAPVRRRRTASETAAREMTPFAYYPPWRAICKLAHIPTDINPHIIRHEFISRLYECTELNDGQIAALVGDVNVLSLTRYRHLQVERLRGQQDAHLDEIAAVMTSMRERRLDTH